MTEDKISSLNISIQWLKDVLRRNREFKVDIDIHGNHEELCQECKDVLLKEGINVSLGKYNGINVLIFTNQEKVEYKIQEKILKYQKEIMEHISWLKYEVRINKKIKINIADLRKNFGGDLFEEDPKIVYQILKYVLSNEKIEISLDKHAGKYELSLTEDDFDEINQPDFPIKDKKLKFINRVPLKPWKDPESLFCDTKFLREFLGKEPRKGKECKDK